MMTKRPTFGFSLILSGGVTCNPKKSYSTAARALQGAQLLGRSLSGFGIVASIDSLEIFEWQDDLPLWHRGLIVYRHSYSSIQDLLCSGVFNLYAVPQS